MATQITFGTSGWRAIVAEDFTVSNVRRAVSGIARYVAGKHPASARIIVGRDPRYMGERFVAIAAEVLGSFGVEPLVIAEPAPTPAISYEVIRSKADGAINFTASHNPPEYSGIKFSTPDGAPALPEATSQIEKLIEEDDASSPGGGSIDKVNIRDEYLAELERKIDIAAIRDAGMRFAY